MLINVNLADAVEIKDAVTSVPAQGQAALRKDCGVVRAVGKAVGLIACPKDP